MYKLEKPNMKYCFEPWEREYEERIGWLKSAKKHGRHTVAYLYSEFDSSTFRYRGYNTSETLEYSIEWSGAYFQNEDIEALCDDISAVDVLVICRCAWNPGLQKLVDLCRTNNIKVGYDVDDLIYHPKYMQLVIETLGLDENLEWNYWYGLTERNRMALELGDFTITTNDYLAKYLREDYPEKKCFIVKNYLNWIQEVVSKNLLEEKLKIESKDEFVIGYFSGSSTHVKDLSTIMPEIEMFMKNHDDVVLRIVGYMELPEKYRYLVDENRIEFVPFQTFIGLQYQQALVDLNVVPLINNTFSNCKSELKYFETAIVGTVTCATPSYAYRLGIRDGVNGFLCEVGEWLPKFEMIYKNRNNKEVQKRISEIALEEYSNKGQLSMLEGTLEEILKG